MSETIDSAPLDAEEVSELREKLYNATIIERIDANSDLARFRIRPDNPIPPFQPGQYVALGLGNWEPRLAGTQEEIVPEKNLRKLARRAYSISCPLLGEEVPDHLREAGELRLTHKQASLEELGQLADPPMTKDAVAGRIRRLLAMADKKAEDDGIPNTEAVLTADMLDG